MNYRRKLTLEETLVDTENLPGFDTARFEGVLERPLATGVFLALGGIFLLVGGVLAARAGYLMLIKGEAYAMRAEDNRLVHQTIVPERGVIFDRAGVPLAYNVPGFRVVVDTRGAKKSVLVPRMEELARALNRDTAEVVTLVERHWEYGEIVIDLIREWSIANDIMTRFKDQDAVRVEPTPLRAYVAVLRGNPGVKIVETNSQGAVLSEGIYRREDRGENLTLSISAELQKKIYEVLEKTAQERGFGGGSAVLLDVRTGETLALVSYPGFDANVMSTGNPRKDVSRILSDESHPLFFRAIAGLYPPASTVKPFLAAAAIDEHVISPEKVIYTEGRIVVPNPFNPERPAIFKDWKNHGPVDMIHAIAVSSDAYFYTIGGGHNSIDGLGVDRMRDYFLRFGLGQTTGIDLLGEEEGLVPSKEWKARAYPDDPLWRVGDSYNMGIGQGWLLTTPLQMARATLELAREGELLRPHLVKSITHNDISALAPLPVSISKSALDVARKGMRLAVTEGTAMGVADIRLPVAAKTGTAEVGKSDWTHSWFIGFLPWEDPRLVLVVNMERGPAGNLIGATSSAHEILQWCFPQGLLTNNC